MRWGTKNGRTRMVLSFPACVLGALVLLVLPLRWVAAVVTAAMLHELGHLAAVQLLGGRVHELRVGASGVVMETEPMTAKQELIAAAAGPMVSLSLLLLLPWIPRLALCGLVQGLYNLVPVYPLDGGRIIKIFLAK